MNMSDDVSGATLQVSMKAAEVTIDTVGKSVDRVMDNIAKLLQAIGNKNNISDKKVRSTDLTDLKPGEVKIKDLIADAKKNGDSISTSEHRLTKSDMKYISKKCKEYGIPVAFTGEKGKDNIYATVRTADLPILQRICTEMMKDKIAERPQELGNFKVQQWEVPFIASELQKHDLAAQFGKTNSGEHFCMYEKADEKAILIARSEFVRKCDEIKKELIFDRDEEGYLTIKDIRSGREFSFEKPPSKEELSALIQEQYGYDKNKADIACAKFGEEILQGEQKQNFFSNNPQNEFSKVDANVEMQGESVLVKEYNCWRMTPKADGVPRIVFQDKDGNFAVLNPEKMTQREMAENLRTHLNITDNKAVLALVDKAEKVSDYYVTQENHTLNYTFQKSDFDMSNPDVVSGMHRTDEDGNTFAKTLPVSSINTEIERSDKNGFTVTSVVTTIETDQKKTEHTTTDTQTLVLSFSDKKNGVKQLTDLYKKQGVPDHIAKQMAKDAFKQAEAQSAEQILLIEEVKADKATISHAGKMLEVDTTDPKTAADEISKEFEVSKAAAEKALEKAADKLHPLAPDELIQDENISTMSDSEKETTAENTERNGHEVHNTDVLKDLKSENNATSTSVSNDAAPKLPDAPPPDVPAPRGRR